MVVDTCKNPVVDPNTGSFAWEDGFYKFYHCFLSSSLKYITSNLKSVTLYIAPRGDKYPHRSEILERTIGGELREALGVPLEVIDIKRSPPKNSRLHQFADVLLGAVSYKFNRHDPRSPSHKMPICETIEHFVGQPLDLDFYPNQRPFNVWGWVPCGRPRWVKGASGVVKRELHLYNRNINQSTAK